MSQVSLKHRRRRRPERKRAITQERILDAAERLFLEQGFRAASVHQIAAEAGYTTGAIYSSFGGKDHLFLEVSRRRIAAQQGIWRDALSPVADVSDAPAAMRTALMSAMLEPAWLAALFEFLSYAARNEELRREAAEIWAHGVPPFLEELLHKSSSSSPLPLERVVPLILGLMRGLTLSWFVDPDAADYSLFSDGVAVLMGVTPPESLSEGEMLNAQVVRR